MMEWEAKEQPKITIYGVDESKHGSMFDYTVFNAIRESFCYFWTTDPPTEEGWYWAWCDGDTEPVCLKIIITNSGIPLTVMTILSASEFTYWLGPLPVPDSPSGKAHE
jgi:hypothetical protein